MGKTRGDSCKQQRGWLQSRQLRGIANENDTNATQFAEHIYSSAFLFRRNSSLPSLNDGIHPAVRPSTNLQYIIPVLLCFSLSSLLIPVTEKRSTTAAHTQRPQHCKKLRNTRRDERNGANFQGHGLLVRTITRPCDESWPPVKMPLFFSKLCLTRI